MTMTTNTNAETAPERVWVYYDSGARAWCVQIWREDGDCELVSCHHARAQAELSARRLGEARGLRVVVWAREVHA